MIRTCSIFLVTLLCGCSAQHPTVRSYQASVTYALPAAQPLENPLPRVCASPAFRYVDKLEIPIKGESRIHFLIGGDGFVYEPIVVETTLPGAVNVAILRALLQWEYAPRTENGQALHVPATLEVNVMMDDHMVNHDMCGRHSRQRTVAGK